MVGSTGTVFVANQQLLNGSIQCRQACMLYRLGMQEFETVMAASEYTHVDLLGRPIDGHNRLRRSAAIWKLGNPMGSQGRLSADHSVNAALSQGHHID